MRPEQNNYSMGKQFYPIITIVTPSFNQGQFIEETILSVLNQTYKNIQYIIVDGGSTDKTMEVINKYRDRIDIIIREKDKGQTNAINKGFRLAKGKLVGWINSDDILYPDCIEKIVELYENNNDGAIYYCSTLDWINENGAFLTKRYVSISNKEYLLNTNSSIIQQGSFYSNKLVKKINYLDEEIYYCMDLDLWLRLLDYGPIYSLKEKSYSAFRMYSGTKTDTGKIKFLRNIKDVILRNGGKWYSRNIIIGFYYCSLKHYIRKAIYG
jgi:glycosyltransferase involved in cell wall biosynthesis